MANFTLLLAFFEDLTMLLFPWDR